MSGENKNNQPKAQGEQAQQRKSLNINRVQGNNLNKSLQTSQIYYDVDRLLLWLRSSYTNIDLQNTFF